MIINLHINFFILIISTMSIIPTAISARDLFPLNTGNWRVYYSYSAIGGGYTGDYIYKLSKLETEILNMSVSGDTNIYSMRYIQSQDTIGYEKRAWSSIIIDSLQKRLDTLQTFGKTDTFDVVNKEISGTIYIDNVALRAGEIFPLFTIAYHSLVPFSSYKVYKDSASLWDVSGPIFNSLYQNQGQQIELYELHRLSSAWIFFSDGIGYVGKTESYSNGDRKTYFQEILRHYGNRNNSNTLNRRAPHSFKSLALSRSFIHNGTMTVTKPLYKINGKILTPKTKATVGIYIH